MLKSGFILWLMIISLFSVNCCSGRSDSILVVGATGTTGLRAIQGLLDAGYKPHQLHILTRNSKRPKMKQLKRLGFHLIQADLQSASSLTGIGKGCNGCYIHATGGDTKELDTTEVSSALNLSEALHSDVTSIVYNSAAAAKGHGVKRIQQKHDIESILMKLKHPCHVTCLRANLFMEELWKHYTRPQILTGEYPLPANKWRRIYLTSVRDMGHIGGTIIARDKTRAIGSKSFRRLNVAGDCLTGPQIAKAFGISQGSACVHRNAKELTKMAKESFPDLYEQIKFIQTSPEKTKISSLRREFPGMITLFKDFLEETHWGNRELSFDDLSRPDTLSVDGTHTVM